ncbi:MAG: cyclase family protein [bacterium]
MENRIVFCLAMSFCIISCTPSHENQVDQLDQLFSGQMEIIDLTHPLSINSTYWPNPENKTPFEHDTLIAQPSGAPAMAAYSIPEHFGTHIDAPIHSADFQKSVDQLTPKDLFGPAAVIDVSAKCEADPDYRLAKQDILYWEAQHGTLPDGVIVIMFTGWGAKWDDQSAYRNEGADGRMHFSGYSEEAAQFLVSERKIKGIGIDNFSVDYGLSLDFPVHKIVNGAGKYHLENIAKVDLLPSTGAYLIVAPVKIAGGSGGQVRIFAVVLGR